MAYSADLLREFGIEELRRISKQKAVERDRRRRLREREYRDSKIVRVTPFGDFNSVLLSMQKVAYERIKNNSRH